MTQHGKSTRSTCAGIAKRTAKNCAPCIVCGQRIGKKLTRSAAVFTTLFATTTFVRETPVFLARFQRLIGRLSSTLSSIAAPTAVRGIACSISTTSSRWLMAGTTCLVISCLRAAHATRKSFADLWQSFARFAVSLLCGSQTSASLRLLSRPRSSASLRASSRLGAAITSLRG